MEDKMEDRVKLNRKINAVKRFADIINMNVKRMDIFIGSDFDDTDELSQMKILCNSARMAAINLFYAADYIDGAIKKRGNEIVWNDQEEDEAEQTPCDPRGDASLYPQADEAEKQPEPQEAGLRWTPDGVKEYGTAEYTHDTVDYPDGGVSDGH